MDNNNSSNNSSINNNNNNNNNWSLNNNCCQSLTVEERFEWEYEQFLTMYVQTYKSLYLVELILIAFGLLGNLLALATLISSRKMQSPSFLYHKTLMVANLMFCLNYACVQGIDRDQGGFSGSPLSKEQQFVFESYTAAFYSGVLKSVIASVCGYLANYMCLLISLDRFSGMILYRCYTKFNSRRVALRLISFTALLSVAVHSWAAWIETSVVDMRHEQNALHLHQNGNQTHSTNQCCYTWMRKLEFSEIVTALIQAKNVINLVTRLVSAVLLTLFTGSTLYAYIARSKRRKQFGSLSCRRHILAQRGRSRSLFILMTVVAVLSYIEDLPREAKRLLQLIYPMNYVLYRMSDPHLPVDERLVDFRLLLYLYQYSQMWLNLFTVMNSSLPFYCYLAFNPIFRQEAQRTAVAYCWRLVALVKRRGMSSRTPKTMSPWKNVSI
ncbi:hypothetical protein T11_8260 [Trichinella zimbabwensis]|uniref:G-protein coupled receptors family 1 profile domain-containing protein n=1 Tax=Trichinella zimbabwensis TaxID=268475 RepID=A0A0V1HUF9_9BILA|nr:hypothetical protein T11_8260 [Trichinella zimbabwensis]